MSPYFDGCYFDPGYFDAAPCRTGVGGHPGRRRTPPIAYLEAETPQREPDDEYVVALLL